MDTGTGTEAWSPGTTQMAVPHGLPLLPRYWLAVRQERNARDANKGRWQADTESHTMQGHCDQEAAIREMTRL